jgi:hypothetical protein
LKGLRRQTAKKTVALTRVGESRLGDSVSDEECR